MDEIITMLEGASKFFYQQNSSDGNEILSFAMSQLISKVKEVNEPEPILHLLHQIAEKKNQQDWVLLGDLVTFELLPVLKEMRGL